jgi:DNA helicase-2/ATP-dependent DNA helicase PcrA
MLKKVVAGTIFEQKMQNQMNNGDFAILYRKMHNLVRWKMRLENEIFPTAYGGLSFTRGKK